MDVEGHKQLELGLLKEAAHTLTEAGVVADFREYLEESLQAAPPSRSMISSTDALAQFMANHLEGFLNCYQDGR